MYPPTPPPLFPLDGSCRWAVYALRQNHTTASLKSAIRGTLLMYDSTTGYEGQELLLNDDQRAHALKLMEASVTGLNMLASLFIKEDPVQKQSVHSVLYVLESNASELGKLAQVFTESEAARTARYGALREANVTIENLRREMGSQTSASQVENGLKVLSAKLELWWDVQGFGHIAKASFGRWGGAELELSCSLFGVRSLLSSKTPVSDKKTHEQWLEDLQKRGFELVVARRGEDPALRDTDSNRQLLEELILRTFPSAALSEFRASYAGGPHERVRVMREIKLYIRDLSEIEALEMPAKVV